MLARRLLTLWMRSMLWFLCRVYGADELERIPERGPLILVGNHINFLEVPVLYTRLASRPLGGWVKADNWRHPVLGQFFDILGGANTIRLRRGEADVDALHKGLARLQEGVIFCVSPEGTRSGHGRLQQAHPGVVVLALHSGAPIMPVVYYGGERFWQNLPRLRRTDFYIRVGNPFRLEADGRRVTREMRQQMVDEIMWQMAALLPPNYRGVYANLDAATQDFLRFPDGSAGNLKR
jgi:1-acyl-sn-glycerol-3-phosphate acyltransferase